jgi:predicted small lipoprotein YifL
MMGRGFPRYFGLVMVLSLLLGVAAVSGCGKKGPPRAPEKPGQAVAAPEELTARISGSELTLTWTHAVDPKNANLVPRFFEVSMAVARDCQGCPFIFRPAGQTSMPGTVFQMTLDGTGPWYFRVQAVADHDVRSEYSKTVVVEEP